MKDAKGDGTAFLVGEGTPSDPASATSPGGVQWRVNFTVGDVALYTSVRITVPLSGFSEQAVIRKTGTKLLDVGPPSTRPPHPTWVRGPSYVRIRQEPSARWRIPLQLLHPQP